MMIRGLAFVALPAENPQRAGDFYRNVIGLSAGDWNIEPWVEVETPCGCAIALEHAKLPYVALESDNIVSDIARFEAQGVEVEGGIMPPAAEVADPDCRSAWIRDTEGNKIMIHQKRPAEGW